MKTYIKKFLPIVLAISMIMCSMVLCTTVVDFNGLFTPVASAAEAGDLSYMNNGDETCQIYGFRTGAVDKSGELIIPETINGLTVTSIRQNAFKGCTELTKVVIPDTVTTIEFGAFQDCEKLNDIKMPKNLTTLGSNAFKNTAYYNNEANWENDILYLDTCLLATKTSISGEVVIKDGTTVMANSAFTGQESSKDVRKNLTKVTIPGSLSVVSDSAFAWCKGLTEVVLLEGVKAIEASAFTYCSNLVKITIPVSVEKFGRGVFGSNYNLAEPYYNGTVDQWVNIDFNTHADSPVYWAETLYINGEKLTEAVISTPIVKKHAFKNCQSLEKVTFTDSVVEVQDEVFSDNYYLTEVTVGKNVKKFGYQVFQNCGRIEKINTTQTVNEWSQIDFHDLWSNPIVNSDSLYINGELLERATFSGVTSIKPFTFYSCASLKSVSIPNTVEVIGEGAFASTSIEELIIADGLTTIEADAFRYCSALKKVVLPSTLTKVDRYAFENAANINYVNFNGTIDQWVGISFFHEYSNPVCYSKNLYINDQVVEDVVIKDVKNISSYAFSNCETIKTLYLPDGFEKIGRDSFKGCANLKSVDFPSSFTTSVSDAFSMCFGLEKVNYRGTINEWATIVFQSDKANPVFYSRCLYLNDVLLENAEIKEASRVYDYTFPNCDSLKTLVVGGNTTKIGRSFEGCKGLTSIEIQESVTGIGSFAFKGCTSLVDVDISAEGEKLVLSSYAFYECSSLEEVSLPKKITSIGNSTFQRCLSLKTVYLSKDIRTVGYDAFYNCPSLEIVYYESDETAYKAIRVQSGNEALASAEIHYNVADVESHYTTITVPATCTEDGSISKSCPCGYSSFTIIHASNHKHITINQKDVTCTTDGYTGDEICETCKEVFKTGTIIKALGHTGGLATCEAPALCERCHQNYGEALSHSYTNDKDTICNECGFNKAPDVDDDANQNKPDAPNGSVQTPNDTKPSEDVTKPNLNTQPSKDNVQVPNNNTSPSKDDDGVPSTTVPATKEDNQASNNNIPGSNDQVQDSDTKAPYFIIGGLLVAVASGLGMLVFKRKRK